MSTKQTQRTTKSVICFLCLENDDALVVESHLYPINCYDVLSWRCHQIRSSPTVWLMYGCISLYWGNQKCRWRAVKFPDCINPMHFFHTFTETQSWGSDLTLGVLQDKISCSVYTSHVFEKLGELQSPEIVHRHAFIMLAYGRTVENISLPPVVWISTNRRHQKKRWEKLSYSCRPCPKSFHFFLPDAKQTSPVGDTKTPSRSRRPIYSDLIQEKLYPSDDRMFYRGCSESFVKACWKTRKPLYDCVTTVSGRLNVICHVTSSTTK